MSFSDIASHLNAKSKPETLFEEIKGKLPLPYKEIARLWGYDLSDKESKIGKAQRGEFAAIIKALVDDGVLIEKNGRYDFPENSQRSNIQQPKPKQARAAFKISSEIQGVVHVLKNKIIFEPLDGDIPAMEMESSFGEIDGAIVTARLTDDFSSVAHIISNHGNMDEENALGKISALSAGIPLKFSDDILSDTPSLEIPKASKSRRSDMTKIPFITIDPVTARDFDDAICVRRTTKGWTVMVAIADVSHYVKPGSKLAIEAHKRGNSTYLPDMVIPMLPEELSNGVCSLKPNENRAAVVCTMHINKNGDITEWKFERALIKSRMRLNYEQVQDAIEGDRSKLPRNGWGYIEKALEVYNARLKDKKRRGALNIDSSEQRISIGKSRDISLALEVGNEAHGIIEELMIAANICAAKTLKSEGVRTIKRVHGTPKEEVYAEFIDPLHELGIHIPKSGDIKHRILNIIHQIPNCDDPDMAYILVTKMQDMAVYSTEDLEHFGLQLKDYTHETSPIRRMIDYYIHCQLNEVLNLSEGYVLSDEMKKNMQTSADHFSRRERISQQAERECQRRYMALWVKRNLSETFQGVVTNVNGKQLWVKVENDGVSIKTAIRRENLPNSLSDYKNGDKILLRPTKANIVTGVIEFEGLNPSVLSSAANDQRRPSPAS